METLCRYVVSVVAAALLCGIVTRLTQACGSADMIRMLCGVFMTAVLIQPVLWKKDLLWESVLPEIDRRAEEIVKEGAASAEIIREEFIKQRLEAYISNRAAAMDAQIKASVTLGEDGSPVSVRITGTVSPMNRSGLSQMITDELGIPREQQEWNG